MAKPGTVTGWKLPSDEREQLLERFPPRYENVIADHVTLRVGATPQTPLPRKAEARIVGRADDGDSLECLVVELDGTTFTYADVVNIMRDVLGFEPGWPSTAGALAAVRAVQSGQPVSAKTARAAAAALDNGAEAKLAIACSETNNPRLPQLWPLAAAFADRVTPYFGASWAYISQACATWPARDLDRYAGPFDRKTAAPLLLANMVLMYVLAFR